MAKKILIIDDEADVRTYLETLFKNNGYETATAEDGEAARAELAQEYRDKFASPYIAAEVGYVDEVIEPRETRSKLITALEMLQNKRDTNPPKKHGNIPL